MKKFTLILLCAGMATAANAQKNSVLLFGDLNGSMITNNIPAASGNPAGKDVSNMFNIMPGVGYQFTDKWTLGVEASFNYNGTNSTTAGTTFKTYEIGAGGGIFGRYSINITPLLYFYTQADAIYTSSTSYGDSKQDGPNVGQFSLNITPVIGINIKNGYGLNFGFGGIGYAYTNTPAWPGGPVMNGGTLASTTSGITYSIGKAFTIGVSKNFIHHVKKPEAKPVEDMGGASDQ